MGKTLIGYWQREQRRRTNRGEALQVGEAELVSEWNGVELSEADRMRNRRKHRINQEAKQY